MLNAWRVIKIVMVSALVSCGGCTSWRGELDRELALMGHRNWVVVADSAYPLQSNPGIRTIDTQAGQLETVQQVLAAVEKAPHLRPVLYTDAELTHVPEADAAGIAVYRQKLAELFEGRTVNSLPHEQIITKLDQAAKMFNVLLLKTKMTLPYSSVFIQLDCGYWSAEAQQRLEKAIEKR